MEQEQEHLDRRFSLRVSASLYDAILRRARMAKRKPADWIRYVIEERVEEEERGGE